MKKLLVTFVLSFIVFTPLRSAPAQVGSSARTPTGGSNGLSTTAQSERGVTAAASVTTSPSPEANKSTSPSNAFTVSSPASTDAVTKHDNGDRVAKDTGISTGDPALKDIYKIGVGDVLDIRLLNSATSRSTLYSVLEGGLVDLPIAGGPIAVAGLSTKEIQARITSELKRLGVDDRSQVVVAVRQYASHTVVVTGLVGSPGTKILRSEAVPLYVLLAEVQPRLDAGNAAIIREGEPTQIVDLRDSTAINFIVRPGDIITLTARPPVFYYIGGRINYPGQKSFQEGITLVQAILAAGGNTRQNTVELSRESSDGRLVTTRFNLKEIKSGRIQDPRLQADDRIEVVH